MTVITIPNAITLTRIILIPVFISMIIYEKNLAALCLFIFAGITDALDGMIARIKNQKTPLGTFLDPLADKFLLVSSFVLFTIYGWIPKWFTITVISRDLIVVIGWILLYLITNDLMIKPHIMGKIAIAMQFVIISYVLVRLNMPELYEIPFSILVITAGVTALSGLHYIYRGLHVSNEA